MPNVAVLTNDLQYEFTHKISTDPQELSGMIKQFNVFLDGSEPPSRPSFTCSSSTILTIRRYSAAIAAVPSRRSRAPQATG